MSRHLAYSAAIWEGQNLLLDAFPEVVIMGLGVPTPTGVFGTTTGLAERYGLDRVVDIPAAENGITGVALGASLMGMRPILVHPRVDFAVLSMEQIVNQAAKWHYMYGGSSTAPLTIRMIIGRGWGQGPQHSQSLQSWFAHIPGLHVLMPATPADAKDLLVSSVLSDSPSVILEHRWLYGLSGPVLDGLNPTPLGKAAIRLPGADVTLVATSHMVIEALAAADWLKTVGISLEVIDLRTIAPLDIDTCIESVEKTGRLLVADTSHAQFGVSAEVIARISEGLSAPMKTNPQRVALPHCPSPTTPSLAQAFYPRWREIVAAACRMCDVATPLLPVPQDFEDTPDPTFVGPY